ncbi:unnamed protein product, partial [Gulo gulo]
MNNTMKLNFPGNQSEFSKEATNLDACPCPHTLDSASQLSWTSCQPRPILRWLPTQVGALPS